MFEIILGLMLALAPVQDIDSGEWHDAGTYRITTYCQYCNEPAGKGSASGKELAYGDVAMNGVPLGTEISIEGETFTVVDRCGIENTVDIFVENDSGQCQCNLLEHKEVCIHERP